MSEKTYFGFCYFGILFWRFAVDTVATFGSVDPITVICKHNKISYTH